MQTPPQQAAIPLGLARKNLLISSPTGTGKTLAAFLPVFSSLAIKRDGDRLFARTYALYVSPLRALGYDVEHNVRRPLREMNLLERPTSERGKLRRGRIREAFVRTGVRTGDTPREERRLMLSRPPHILLTTPESLAVMLGMDSYRKTLRNVETVIVDEVHALAGKKRGAQLALLLESLEELVEQPFNRIGLSATVSPLERVAAYVSGDDRPFEIVDCRGLRSIHLDIAAPFAGAVAPLAKLADTAVELMHDVRTSLVFSNVRSQAERTALFMAQSLEDREAVEVPEEPSNTREYDTRIGVHHSSLERSVRHRVEAALRAGTLRAVVCSSSLELGIDIGWIDRVFVVGGARGVTATLQRIGRAGHRPDAIADGVVLAQDRDDIIEAAATRRCIADGALEEIQIPRAPLDVIAQWLVMSVCYDKRLALDDALRIARRAAPYASLQRDDLIRCAQYLSGGGVGDDPAHVRRLGFDGDAVYGLGREVCAAYFENVGTIPDESHVVVRVGGDSIGRIEEGFVNELRVGDVFVLNGKTFRVKEIDIRGVGVEPFAGRPTIPQWSSHIKGIGPALAREIVHLRAGVAQRLEQSVRGAHEWLAKRYNLEGTLAAHVVRYIAQQKAVSAVPEAGRPIVELYVMDGRQTAVFHTGAGRRVNETLARVAGARLFAALRADTGLTTDDNGFMVSLPPGKRLPDALWAKLLAADDFERDVMRGLRGTHMLRNMFRYVANTGLLVLRRAGGRSLRRNKQKWNSGRILDQVAARDPDFPLLRETLRMVTHDLLDLPGTLAYVSSIEPELRVVHPAAASPFTFGIVTSSFGDSVVLDERVTMVEALHHRMLVLMGERPPPVAVIVDSTPQLELNLT